MRALRNLLLALAIAASTVPVAFVATFLPMPLWSAIESTTGIESVGHSGPAEWCFFAIWAPTLGVAIGAAVLLRRSRTGVPAGAGEKASRANAADDWPPLR